MILSFRNLTLGYEAHPAVHHLSASIDKGMLVALVGPNGAGKSTLLKGIMGQLAPLEGDIQFGPVEKDDIAYLPQQNMVDRSFPITVQEMVALGAWKHMGAFGRLRSKHKKQVAQALQQLGLSGFEKRLIGSLSGGQMQRVLFARLLVQEANLILLDEPFTGVDSRTTHDLLHLIQHWHEQGKTIVAVLHDLEQVKSHFPHCLLLSREPIAFGPTADVLTEQNWQRARQLNEAFDENAVYCGAH
ncbi:ABC transporter [Oleiphilus sp. HI0068]|jgi:zinc/manganese transport system ATP-binding protein|uniref:zinc ABC transporter ATP-binding protein AztA n=4 Tax=unclassified Oleiphilus TaxID=2631174 RepID=UPI0007C29DC1|nr:zinc ABC transporter ATP-binding protein AztA [Oleiphilus sp. HI0132]KZY84696.1 ABC transporter [Oleiphilus sp. HI0068]KZY85313.1 ABC transporter [Oleiphilus sp. HI0069]KZZ32693.1 ABC transporter [Oleiphilus sp. HI0085]KZZ76164.1 ABC transporter [Oleiphilus sp. HI0132]